MEPRNSQPGPSLPTDPSSPFTSDAPSQPEEPTQLPQSTPPSAFPSPVEPREVATSSFAPQPQFGFPPSQPAATEQPGSRPTVFVPNQGEVHVGGDPTMTAMEPRSFTASAKLTLILAVAVMVILALGSSLYFWVLPDHWDASYVSSVTPLYNQQASKMTAAFVSFGLPVFSDNNSTDQEDTANLVTVNADIKAADNATTALQAKNHLTVLPGSGWTSKTKSATQKYQAMKTYISDSQTFLSDYQTLSTYVTQLDSIFANQLPGVVSAEQAVSGQSNVQDLLTQCQNAAAALSGLINSMNTLKAPTDLAQFNSSIIDDLSTMNSGYQGIISGINVQSSSEVENSANQLVEGALDLERDSTINVAGLLQDNSTLHSQIIKLEAENPLDMSTSATVPSGTPSGTPAQKS